MQYTQQAEALISTQEYFKRADFEKWYKKENKVINYIDLMNFLLEQKQIGVIEFANLYGHTVIDRELVIDEEIEKFTKKVNIDLLKKRYIKACDNIGDQSIRIYLNKDKYEEQKENNKKMNEITEFLTDNFDKIKKLV